MPSLTGDDKGGAHWMLTFADTMQSPQQPRCDPHVTDPALANVTVPRPACCTAHRSGRRRFAAGGDGAAAGPRLIKQHDFVEMTLLNDSRRGGTQLRGRRREVGTPDKVIIGRPGGLTLSSADIAAERATAAVRPIFDVTEWRKNQAENFAARQDALISAAGASSRQAHQAAQPRPFPDVARDGLAKGR
jgi:hypothetical protein